MAIPETIDARVTRLQGQLAVSRLLSIEDGEWLCRELQRAREALFESLNHYDDVTVRTYFDKDVTK